MKHEGWFPADLGGRLSFAQKELLRRYAVLLQELAMPKKMLAAGDSARIWNRHVLDGLRGAGLIPRHARAACDLGSGAGIPGLPVAIARPKLSMVLTEPRRDRAAFLELAALELGLRNVSVHPAPAQELGEPVDVCLARAFRGPTESWLVADPLLAAHGVLLYWAGRRADLRVEGVQMRAFSVRYLADAGPIVMMTRQ